MIKYLLAFVSLCIIFSCDSAGSCKESMIKSCATDKLSLTFTVTLFLFTGLSHCSSVTRTAGNFAWEFLCSKISVIVSGRVCNVYPSPKQELHDQVLDGFLWAALQRLA